jgi:hypothetical protein
MEQRQRMCASAVQAAALAAYACIVHIATTRQKKNMLTVPSNLDIDDKPYKIYLSGFINLAFKNILSNTNTDAATRP